MKELLRRSRPGARRAPRPAAPSCPDVRLRAAARGRRAARRDRRADRRVRERRLRRGRGGGGDRAAPGRRPCPRHPLRDQRRGGVGRRAGLRRHDRRARRAGRAAAAVDRGRGRRPATSGAAVVTPLPADSPPAAFGPHEPGDGAPPEPPLVVHDDGRLEGSLGSGGARCRARRARPGRAPPRHVADRRARRPAAVHRGVSGPAAARRRRRRPGRDVARRVRPRARLRDGRRRRPGGVRDAGAVPATSTGSSSAGRTRSPTRSASGRTTRSRC